MKTITKCDAMFFFLQVLCNFFTLQFFFLIISKSTVYLPVDEKTKKKKRCKKIVIYDNAKTKTGYTIKIIKEKHIWI
jgi:hypothetical protein